MTAMPFSELMNEHHGMSFGNSSDQQLSTCFFPKYVVKKTGTVLLVPFKLSPHFAAPSSKCWDTLEVRHPRLHGSGRTLLACGSSRGPDL